MFKATVTGVLFMICSLTASGQSTSDSSKSARDFIIEQEERRSNHPDNRNKNRIKEIKTVPDSSQSATKDAETKKKKKRCFFCCRRK